MNRHIWLLAAVSLACGGGEDRPSDPPDTGTADAPAADTRPDVMIPSDELAEYIASMNVTILEMNGEGVEIGQNTTGADGWARFWSPEHEGLVEFEVDAPEVGVLANEEVLVSIVGDRVFYIIADPSETYEPMLHSFILPEDGEHEMSVDSAIVSNGSELDYDPERDGDPFAEDADKDAIGGVSQPLLLGVVVRIAIGSTLRGIGVAAVVGVFKNLVQGACNFADPLHAERCAIIGQLAGLAGFLYAGIYVTGATAWGLGATFLSSALSLADMNCSTLGGALVSSQSELTVGGPSPAETRYLEVARRFNYLMHVMETDPQPGQPSWDTIRDMALELIAVRDALRSRRFLLINEGTDVNLSDGLMLGTAKSATKDFFGSLHVSVQTAVEGTVAANVRPYLRLGSFSDASVIGGYKYTNSPIRLTQFSSEYGDFGNAVKGQLIGCAFNFISGALIEYDDLSGMADYELSTAEIIGGMLDVFEVGITKTYERHWTDAIPDATCMLDLYEPNHTWQLAMASPVDTELGSGTAVNLDELTLCDAIGSSGDDHDFYGYYNAPIDFRVAARLTGVDGGRGQTERVCMNISYISEAIVLAAPRPSLARPEPLRRACGTPGGTFETSEFGVARVTGSRWSMVLIEVEHEDPSMSMQDVEYGLRWIR